MRILYSFLIILASVLLALLPFSGAQSAILTDLRKDTFYVSTSVGSDNSTVQLYQALYNNDTSSISFASHSVLDTPLAASYNSTSRALLITGLSANLSRNIDVTYDVDAVNNSAFVTALTALLFIWFIMIGVFAIGSLVWLWRGPVMERLSRA